MPSLVDNTDDYDDDYDHNCDYDYDDDRKDDDDDVCSWSDLAKPLGTDLAQPLVSVTQL